MPVYTCSYSCETVNSLNTQSTINCVIFLILALRFKMNWFIWDSKSNEKKTHSRSYKTEYDSRNLVRSSSRNTCKCSLLATFTLHTLALIENLQFKSVSTVVLMQRICIRCGKWKSQFFILTFFPFARSWIKTYLLHESNKPILSFHELNFKSKFIFRLSSW